MNDQSVIRFPVDGDKIVRNTLGPFAVPCEVSSHWLQFEPHYDQLNLGDLVRVDVMQGAANNARRVRTLYLRPDDIRAVLDRITPRPSKSTDVD